MQMLPLHAAQRTYMNQVIYSLRDAGDEEDCCFISLIMHYFYFPRDETLTHVIKDRFWYWLYMLR